jgi:general secretion pathway protein A
MYAAHFGLTERPFSLAPDPRYLFFSAAHQEALAHLVYGLHGGGFVQLTGDVGTGKTTVCRALLEQLPSDVDVAMIFTPHLTTAELLSAICDELCVPYPVGTASRKVLIDALSHALVDAHARGRRTVLIIDEAQNLSVDVLEELRLLTNIETRSEKLLQVILIGQSELVDLMEQTALRPFAQRITARYHLRPLSLSETRAYVRHRLQAAGQRRMIFTSPALRVIYRRSGGVPRLVNSICDRALLGAFARSKRRVTAAIARRGAMEVSGSAARRRWVQPAIAVAILAAIVAGGSSYLEYGATWWNQRVRPPGVALGKATVAVMPSASVAGVVAPSSGPSLGPLLNATTVDRDAALASLFARWSVDVPSQPGTSACDIARGAGLRCLIRTGTWNVIRRLDVPVMLTLMTPTGERHYAIVTALGADTVTLDLPSGPMTLPLRDVERFWDGAFLALWRLPEIAATPLKPGDDLRERVREFQRANGLRADGVLGEETLLRLAATTPGLSPSLSKTTPSPSPLFGALKKRPTDAASSISHHTEMSRGPSLADLTRAQAISPPPEPPEDP